MSSKLKFESIIRKITLKDFFYNQLLFGESAKNWNHENKNWVVEMYRKRALINSSKIIHSLRRAMYFLYLLYSQSTSSHILFVNGIFGADNLSKLKVKVLTNTLKRIDLPFLQRWRPGFLRNFKTYNTEDKDDANLRKIIKPKISKILELQKQGHQNLNKFLRFSEESKKLPIKKFKNKLTGKKFVPSLVVFLGSADKFKAALRESVKLRIPTCGIVDTNSSALNVLYPIYSNDDSIFSLLYILNFLNKSICFGDHARKENNLKLLLK